MPSIMVTPLALIDDTIRARAPSHLLTLLGPDYMIDHHKSFDTPRHLRIKVNDIAWALPGQTEPRNHHAKSVLAFVDSWDRKAPMLVHCWAGISRSTASMFMALCKLNPKVDELAILRRMRRLAPHIAPNPLLVAHADQLLGREGRMVDALDAIGPAIPASEGFLFELPATITPGDLD
ncbi:hypothetical protein sos41_27450 [Alphaproteobacteria bacterium SO-S41]|nr:hypothetical protein sos41_27450 [Alphaproteobacteria bacterium SO-S41]